MKENFFSVAEQMILIHAEHQASFVLTSHQADAELASIAFMILLVTTTFPQAETISVERIFHLPFIAHRLARLV